ncbi:MAG TPA: (4Fe-4S)-binding protein, partial [Candidatus Altiarchaeales archaeon]|nr:(4Fe-4S)-binding protein [Candidatus Altiarchaeales archaeon]
MHEAKQLTVISGKGGTGKTSIVSAFASLAKNAVFADCDVDAADLHLIMKPKIVERTDFRALDEAVIDGSKCVKCGKCVEACRFGAISSGFAVKPFSCEGCGVCEIVCPAGAISMREKVAGESFVSKTRFGRLCHARLNPGEEASGKLVSVVRERAKKIAQEQGNNLIIIDGSPGIGCPVIASIGGVELCLVVTEPTASGIHDLERVLGVARHFKVRPLVCINKFDINEEKSLEIEEWCKKNGVKVVGKIPYDVAFTKAMIAGKTIIEYDDDGLSENVRGVWS